MSDMSDKAQVESFGNGDQFYDAAKGETYTITDAFTCTHYVVCSVDGGGSHVHELDVHLDFLFSLERV